MGIPFTFQNRRKDVRKLYRLNAFVAEAGAWVAANKIWAIFGSQSLSFGLSFGEAIARQATRVPQHHRVELSNRQREVFMSLRRIVCLVAALTFPATSVFATSLDYTFTGQFLLGSSLGAISLDLKNFEVHIFADTTIPDNDPGNPSRGEFLGPFSAQISIEGLGIYSFVNPISMITERTDSPGFQPIETRATFGGGSTSSMAGFSPAIPFFGNPNLLDPFPGGANVVVADFNAEPVMALGEAGVLSLSGDSPGGSVRATIVTGVPETGSTLAMLGLSLLGLAVLYRKTVGTHKA
jgi:hypothetical protein